MMTALMKQLVLVNYASAPNSVELCEVDVPVY